MDEVVNAKMEKYAKKFGDGFPTIPLARGRSDQEVIMIIDECLSKGKDVYELGYVSNDPDIDY